MSKISLEPNASGAGTFTLAAPNSDTNRTLTLPDEEGTVATIENIPPGYEDQDALDLFNVTGSAPVFACRAWVRFNAHDTGSPVIGGSGNVSSITDVSTGRFTVNFATSMPDLNYIAQSGSGFRGLKGTFDNVFDYTESKARLQFRDDSGTDIDVENGTFMAVR